MPHDSVLSADWFPVASCEQLAHDKPLAARLLGEDLVLWRNAGHVMAWQDLCLHRGARLSMGQIDPGEGALACPYHGWRYGVSGACVYIPAHPE
jgi:phenylpropionate dioxygenase-like ring-hydroxylating dioxygenase large terminal subunit